MFLFSHLTYLVQLLYLRKLSRPRYQQKLQKIMKISQKKMWFWLTIFICQSSMVHGEHWVNCPTRLETWNHWQSAKRIRKTGTIVGQPGSGSLRLARSSGGPCARSGGQAKKASVSSLDFAWNCHSLFKCTQKKNSPSSPAHMLQTMSCSAQLLSEANRISRLTRWLTRFIADDKIVFVLL